MLEIYPEYITAGGNRHPSAADWDHSSGLLAFGAGKNGNDGTGLRCLLAGHTDDVTAVKFFLEPESQQVAILSGSVDRTVRVWQRPLSNTSRFYPAVTLESHVSSINCIATCQGSSLVASGSADATVKIWRIHGVQHSLHVELIQTIPTKPRYYPLALSLHKLEGHGETVLAIAGTTSIVQVFILTESENFTLQATLTGHEGWVRSLAFSKESYAPSSDLVLASASQDKYIRLWRFTRIHQNSQGGEQDPSEAFEQSLSNKTYSIRVSQSTYIITFEALLLGHEDWIYTVAWRLEKGDLRLLSTSADNSLALWESEESSGVWICTTRLGEISSQKGSTTATGSTGGFWIGLWSPSGKDLVSLGRTGSWRLWNFDESDAQWVQGLGVSGHTKCVTGISWSRQGSYLLSTSSDQTTRLHARWRRVGDGSWHEMARPQIHGYDLNCIDCIDDTQFISGADEKLLRVFDEPRATADLLNSLCGVKTDLDEHMPATASIPVLGLSNKVMETNTTGDEGLDKDNHASQGPLARERSEAHIRMPRSRANLEQPPSEDQLARHTLWPETEKLYGHGYEISAVAASHDKTLVATACRASSSEHAVIRIYKTQDWREVKPSLSVHSLTVNALSFAEDDHFLLSVGRDRQWAVFKRSHYNPDCYLLEQSNQKGHSRMILSAAWAPSGAGRVFITASRDKTIKIWKMCDINVECVSSMSTQYPITAVDVCPQIIHNCIIIASGSEMGELVLHVIQIADWVVSRVSELEFL
ncbi:Elongator subunit elp2 [Lecanora helva]